MTTTEPVDDLGYDAIEVVMQIVGIFQPNGNAHRAGRNTRELQFLIAHPVMRSINREHHQRFHSAQAGSKQHNFR